MELKDLVGKHLLSGVQFGKLENVECWKDESTTVDFILNGKIISVIEDPSDGYRSSMRELIVNRTDVIMSNTFSPIEVAGTFRNSEYIKNDIIDFIDSITGKIVLSVGTANINGGYPYFVGDWHPENMCINTHIKE